MPITLKNWELSDMSVYALYDPTAGYLKAVCGSPFATWQQAKQWQRLATARSGSTGAGLMNAGRTSNFVELHEYDNGQFVQSHPAPPDYIKIS
jgi:hypothetical protein